MDDETLKDLPRGVALIWGLVKEPQRGPKRGAEPGRAGLLLDLA